MLLLAGKSRAGKTTASLACARAGWTFAGDDFVFANSLDGRIAPLNCTARLRTDVEQYVEGVRFILTELDAAR